MSTLDTGVMMHGLGEQGPQPAKLRLRGNSNSYHPRQGYADRIASMTGAEFMREAENKIWLSAYAANNNRSDYHWQADACYDESIRRGDKELYNRAWHKAAGQKYEGPDE